MKIAWFIVMVWLDEHINHKIEDFVCRFYEDYSLGLNFCQYSQIGLFDYGRVYRVGRLFHTHRGYYIKLFGSFHKLGKDCVACHY